MSELDKLSAAATQGVWAQWTPSATAIKAVLDGDEAKAHAGRDIARIHIPIADFASYHADGTANAPYIVALVNAHRAGQFVKASEVAAKDARIAELEAALAQWVYARQNAVPFSDETWTRLSQAECALAALSGSPDTAEGEP